MNKVIEADFVPRQTNAESSWPVSINSPATKERKRILVVDDDHHTTHLVKVLLERSGHYLVLEENDATKAHQSAQDFRPDLILLDVVMPETDGATWQRKLRAILNCRVRRSYFSPHWSRSLKQKRVSGFKGIHWRPSRSISPI
jgi:PleD family two-component response regulator